MSIVNLPALRTWSTKALRSGPTRFVNTNMMITKTLETNGRTSSDLICLNVPLFIRLLELAREELANDVDIHKIAEVVTDLGQDHALVMKDYDAIVAVLRVK